MSFEIVILGIVVGLLSGFFGIGGGTILVPMLLFFGYDIKVAVGISVVQMVFSSIYGSYLNLKRGTLDVKMVFLIGVGGLIGAQFSPFIINSLSSVMLETLFLLFVFFALMKLFFKNLDEEREPVVANSFILISIGIVLGAFAISIGVGGSLLLVPILVGFFHVPMKNAIAAGLFFVVFSSLSGFISLGMNGHIDYVDGVIVGLSSLIGVYLGIYLKHKTSDSLQKNMLIAFYLIVASYLIYRLVVLYG